MKTIHPGAARLAVALSASVLLGSAADTAAQSRVVTDDRWCHERDYDNDDARHCEVREETLPAVADLSIDARPNGGIKVIGWERYEVQIRAKVVATAPTDREARDIAGQVRVSTASSRISVDGPDMQRHRGWTVSFEVHVPKAYNLALKTTNGGISITDVAGRITFDAMNGGVTLTGLAGDVRGSTTNGGLDVSVDGTQWQGEGLDVETTNGGVSLRLPEHYSAHLEAGTVNGGFVVDFPITVSGRIDRRISADIGGGGPTLRVTTVNGGMKIRRQ